MKANRWARGREGPTRVGRRRRTVSKLHLPLLLQRRAQHCARRLNPTFLNDPAGSRVFPKYDETTEISRNQLRRHVNPLQPTHLTIFPRRLRLARNRLISAKGGKTKQREEFANSSTVPGYPNSRAPSVAPVISFERLARALHRSRAKQRVRLTHCL